MLHSTETPLGSWTPGAERPSSDPAAVLALLYRLAEPLYLVEAEGRLAVASGGSARLGAEGGESAALRGFVPALTPARLGDPTFLADHGLTHPYVAGAMANGIGSAAIVIAMGQAGMLGFFGAGGLTLDRVEAAIDEVQAALGEAPYGFNLLHSPNEPELEAAVVDLYLRRGVRLVEAAAYLDLTLPLVRYRTAGIHRGQDGSVVTPNRVIGKVSRIEVASKFFAPPPEAMLQALVAEGHLSPEQAELARLIPVAQDLTAEADSGGHTDNRPAIALFPTMLALRDRLQAAHGYAAPLRVGLAGGLATPASVAAAFAMGAAFVVTGSINQACVESGSSDPVRALLAQAQQADVAMAPAGDMFEMGVKVQVLKRGTFFPMRASKLYEIYRAYPSLEAIPADQRAMLERDLFKQPLQAIWASTRQFFLDRDPAQVERAERDPKHQMALVFRWYLGLSSRWANAGDPDRRMDYQIWCGPAMGAFNEWARGSFLDTPGERRVVTVALNLLVGACALTRLAGLKQQGYVPDTRLAAPHVMTLPQLNACLA
ncbi:MAG: PfaD family polyunsaturated fatty acid/polyketide biosynthesis protein [Candidatus Sericytochromatia bacterium]